MATQLYFFWSTTSMAIFFLFYWVLLKRETFFLLNRIYLLTALCLSMILPLFDFSTLIELPKMELISSTLSTIGTGKLEIVAEREFNWLTVVYWTGVLFNSIFLLIKVFKLKKQIKSPKKGSAFSFWKTKVIDQQLPDFGTINEHENVHVQQYHTIDMLLIELIAMFFWFNPLIYGYRNSLKLVHEYLADEQAAKSVGSKKQYAMLLFLHNFKVGPALTNTFYRPSLLTARIAMLQRKKSKAYRLWKYGLCLPLLVLITILCSFSSADFNNRSTNKIDKAATFPGGFSAFSSYLIKNIKKVSPKKGSVKLSFIVETNGKITNEKIENSLDEACGKEALRVISLSPKWEPALQNGAKVRSGYQININF